MAVAAVALIVDGGSLVTADALLPHAGRTAHGPAGLRLRLVLARRQEGSRPLGGAGLLGILGGERREDRPPLALVGLGPDLNRRHLKEGKGPRHAGR